MKINELEYINLHSKEIQKHMSLFESLLKVNIENIVIRGKIS